MGRRATQPQNARATRQANEEFHARHPEMEGESISPTSREHREYRREWLDLYEQYGGEVIDPDLPSCEIGSDQIGTCQVDWVVFVVTDADTGERIPNVPLHVGIAERGIRQYRTDHDGVIAFPRLVASADCGCGGFNPAESDDVLEIIRGTVTRSLDFVELCSHDEDLDFRPGIPPQPERGRDEYAVVEVTEHQVSDGETLTSIAEQHGWPLDATSVYNFGPAASQDPASFRTAVQEYTGCYVFDDNNDPQFSDQCDPGIIYVFEHWGSGLIDLNRVHEIRVRPIPRHHDLELQTVGDLNIMRPGIDLRLWPTTGDPIEIQTDDHGYWRAEDMLIPGLVRVTLPDGTPVVDARLLSDIEEPGTQPNDATINPLLVNSTITTVRIEHLSEPERRQRGALARRYAPIAEEENHTLPELDLRPFNNAVDNLWIAAGWNTDDDEPNYQELCAYLNQWIADRHPVAHRRRFWVDLCFGNTIFILEVGEGDDPDVTEVARYQLQPEYDLRGRFGAYSAFERSGDARVAAIDAWSQTGACPVYLNDEFVPEGANMPEMLSRGDAQAYIDFAQSQIQRRRLWVFYRFPESYGSWVQLARHGGSGVLEDYPEVSNPIFERVHARNRAVLEGVNSAYHTYIEGYIEDVEGIGDRPESELPRSPAGTDAESGDEDAADPGESSAPIPIRREWALRELGPPHSPFHFPLPFGLDFNDSTGRERRLELARLMIRENSLEAWITVAQALNSWWERPSAGSLWLRATFEPSAELALESGADLRSGMGFGETRLRAGDASFMRARLDSNIDVNPDNGDIVSGAEWQVDIGQRDVDFYLGSQAGGNLAQIEARAVARYERYVRVNMSGDDYRNMATATLGLGTSARVLGTRAVELPSVIPELTFEAADNGDIEIRRRATVGTDRVVGNARRGEFGIYKCFTPEGPGGRLINIFVEHLSASSEGDLCLGARLRLLDQDTVLAVVSGAPGYFERLDLFTLLHADTTWRYLNDDTRHALVILGWSMDPWNRKHDDGFPVDAWPRSVRTRWVDLDAAERWAAVRLGFREDDWPGTWRRYCGSPPVIIDTTMVRETAASAGDTLLGSAAESVATDFFNGAAGFVEDPEVARQLIEASRQSGAEATSDSSTGGGQ